jgi:hypothetical protein
LYTAMLPTELVKLTALMERSSGSPDVKIRLVDGPVVTQHADLEKEPFCEIPGHNGASCMQANSAPCLHGAFIAGIGHTLTLGGTSVAVSFVTGGIVYSESRSVFP